VLVGDAVYGLDVPALAPSNTLRSIDLWSSASRSTSLAELFGWVGSVVGWAFGPVGGWVVTVRVLDSIANMANTMQAIYVKSMVYGFMDM